MIQRHSSSFSFSAMDAAMTPSVTTACGPLL
jgi:hypothetical protein